MKDVMDAAFEIDLKILQALLPLTTNFPNVTGDSLAEVTRLDSNSSSSSSYGGPYAADPFPLQVLLICLKLSGSKHAIVSGTAAATARQIVVYLFERVAKDVKKPQSSPDLESEEQPRSPLHEIFSTF